MLIIFFLLHRMHFADTDGTAVFAWASIARLYRERVRESESYSLKGFGTVLFFFVHSGCQLQLKLTKGSRNPNCGQPLSFSSTRRPSERSVQRLSTPPPPHPELSGVACPPTPKVIISGSPDVTGITGRDSAVMWLSTLWEGPLFYSLCTRFSARLSACCWNLDFMLGSELLSCPKWDFSDYSLMGQALKS